MIINHNSIAFLDINKLIIDVKSELHIELDKYNLSGLEINNKDVQLFLTHFLLSKIFNIFTNSNFHRFCLFFDITCIPQVSANYNDADFYNFYMMFAKDLATHLKIRVISTNSTLQKFIKDVTFNAEYYEQYCKGIKKTTTCFRHINKYLKTKGLKQLQRMCVNNPKLKMVLCT